MKLRTAAVLAIAALVTACAAGVNFVKPSDSQLVLGSTTKNQIVALMGEPNGKGQKVSNGENLDIVAYAYAQAGGVAAFEGVTPARSVSFLFHNNVLVGKEFTSSFKTDSTYFALDRAKSIRQGMTEQEVVALVGKAGGEYRYPVIASKDGRALVYTFTQTKGFKSQQSILIVELDRNGRVHKSEFNQIGEL
jgi:hypothetical protein